MRRIALEHRRVSLKEYARDLFAEDVARLSEDDAGKRNLFDIAEFAALFSTCPDAVLLDKFPELINPHFDQAAVVTMYRRFAEEARRVFARHGQLAPLVR